MNLFYLRYFVTLAKVQHYTKAAEQLCIAQPSLSHAITQLEKELGVPLFEKNGRRTVLTRFGEEFLVCAEKTLATLDEGMTSIQRSARGEGLIRLGFIRPLGVEFIPALASEFLKRNGDLEVQFTFHTGVTAQLLDGLKVGSYDLVFCSEPPENLNLTAIPVQNQTLVLLTPKGHPLAARKSVDLSDTLPYPQIYFEKSAGIRGVIQGMFEKIGMEPHIAYETEEDEVVAGLVAKGFGIAVVPYMDLLLKLDVEILQIDSPTYERSLFMVHDEKVFLPPVVERFRQFVQNSDTLHSGMIKF